MGISSLAMIAILAMGAVLMVLAIGLLWWRNVQPGNVEPSSQKPAVWPEPLADTCPEHAQAQVHELLRAGKKIEAIKLVRQHTTWGLKEAKDYVDKLDAGELVPPLSANEPAPSPVPPPDMDAQVMELLAQRKKIEAVKLVRQYTALGLKEAKDYVESLE